MDFTERLNLIAEILDEKKAEHIEKFDLRDSNYFVDGVVVATSVAAKHAAMLTDELKKRLKPEGESFLHVEESDEWTVVDLGDILIHFMSESHRHKYSLEEFLRDFEAKKNSRG